MKLLIALGAYLLVISTSLSSQQKIELLVIDQHSKSSLPFSNMDLSPLNGGKSCQRITDGNGKISVEITLPSVITVSCLGYETKVDTITNNTYSTVALTPKFFAIQDVVVTGQSKPIKADKSIYAIKVLSPATQKEVVTNNLADILMNETNIRITPDLQTGTSVSMQGLSGEYVKYMINGVPVNGRLLGNLDLSQMSMSNVDHVEIIEGPLSVIYGNNALAGTINIITKDQKSNGTSLFGSTYYESVGLSQTDVSIIGKRGKHSFGLSADASIFGGARTVDYLVKGYNWKPKNKFDGELFYQFETKDIKIKAITSGLNEKITDTGEADNNGFFESYYLNHRLNGRLEVEKRINDKSKIDGLVAANYYTRDVEKYYHNTNLRQTFLNSTDSTKILSTSARVNFYNDLFENKVNTTLGFDLSNDDMTGFRLIDQHQTMSDFALYGTAHWKVSPKMSIQPGIRYIYNTKFTAPMLYSLNWQYFPMSHWNFRTSVAKGFRAPDLKELYMEFVDQVHNIHGNPDLKAEKSLSLNGNILYSRTTSSTLFEMEVKGFYNYLINKIELGLISGTGRYEYLNLDYYKSFGGGINFKYKPSQRWSFKTGFTTIGSTNSIAQKDAAMTKIFMFTDVTALASYTNKPTRITLSTIYRYNGHQQTFNMSAGIPGVLTRDAYHTLDATAFRDFWKNRITATIGAKNLFDNTNIFQNNTNGAMVNGGTTDAFPVGWGRSYFIKIALNLSSL